MAHGDFDAARARERDRHAAAVVLVDHCSMCNVLIRAGGGFCFRCLTAISEGWPEDEVTEVEAAPR